VNKALQFQTFQGEDKYKLTGESTREAKEKIEKFQQRLAIRSLKRVIGNRLAA